MTAERGAFSLPGMSATQERQQVTVNGARLAYVERGAGEPVLLVHGSISDYTFWEPILEPVGKRFRAIDYSRRWAWPNDPILEGVPDSVDVHAKDLIALIEKLGLAPVHLVGNSFGAYISLIVARDRPDLVRKVVAQEPPLVPLLVGFPPSPPALLKLIATRPSVGLPIVKMVFGGVLPVQKMVERGEVEASIRRFVRDVALGADEYDRLPEWIKEHMLLNAGTHAAQFRNNGGFVPFTPADAGSIQTPVLVMTGQRSPKPLRVIAAEVARYLPNVRTVEIPNASHAMHLANPEATVKAIVDFLARD